MVTVGLGTPVASGLTVGCVVFLELAATVFGAWMERMVVFFCREKGLGASRGLGARPGLGFEVPPLWETSTELSITESLSSSRSHTGGGGKEAGRSYKRRNVPQFSVLVSPAELLSQRPEDRTY